MADKHLIDNTVDNETTTVADDAAKKDHDSVAACTKKVSVCPKSIGYAEKHVEHSNTSGPAHESENDELKVPERHSESSVMVETTCLRDSKVTAHSNTGLSHSKTGRDKEV